MAHYHCWFEKRTQTQELICVAAKYLDIQKIVSLDLEILIRLNASTQFEKIKYIYKIARVLKSCKNNYNNCIISLKKKFLNYNS